MDRKASNLRNIEEARSQARKALPRVLFDFVDGGAYDEVTVRENHVAYEELAFRTHAAAFPPETRLAKTVLGTRLSMPVICAPCGGVRLLARDGDRALARAAGSAGTAFVMSTGSGTVVEDVADAATGPYWFQLYFQGGRRGAEILVDRVQKAGFGALFVTVDVDTSGTSNHERLFRHRAAFPLEANVHNAIHFMPELVTHPRWTIGFIRDGLPTTYASVPEDDGMGEEATPVSGSSLGKGKPKAAPEWSDIDWIRHQWTGPLVVKGVLTGDDARRARDHGADAIVVSNHGGRQLDYSPAPLRVLPEVKAAVGDDIEVLVDSGIRRGSDVAKALALGADAVMVGRPYLYGLAVAGEKGVARVLEILAIELARTIRHLGCGDVSDLEASMVEPMRRALP